MAESSGQARRHKKSKKRQAMIIGLITLVAVIAMGLYIVHLQHKKADLEESARIVQEQIDEELERAKELEEEKEYRKTREFIEKIARERLGLFYPDEQVLKPDGK